MMKFLKGNISLVFIVAVIFLISFGGYYLLQLKHGKYPVSSFESIAIKWGVGDSLLNHYDSSTGQYQYLNDKDSLVVKHFKLRSNEFIYLNNKLNEFNFWSLPKLIANKGASLTDNKVLRYEIEVKYDEETKKVIYFAGYNENYQIAVQIEGLVKMLTQTINNAEERYTN